MDRCSHICVPTPRYPHKPGLTRRETTRGFTDSKNSVCLCPTGMVLGENGVSCIHKKPGGHGKYIYLFISLNPAERKLSLLSLH